MKTLLNSYCYVNSRRHVDLEKIQVTDGIWTPDPLWSSQMLSHWATGDFMAMQGQIVGIDLNRIAATQPRAGSYELTNSIALSH